MELNYKELVKMKIKFKKLYLSYLSFDNFDSEISIKFTSKNEEAKMIDEKDKEFYDIILSGLGFEVEFIQNE